MAQVDLRHDAGELGRIWRTIGNGARDRIDNDVLCVGVFFSCSGIADAEDIAGIFNQRVLEAATGGKKRPVVHSRKLDAFEHAVEALVRTARRRPEAVEGIEDPVRARVQQVGVGTMSTQRESRSYVPRAGENRWSRDGSETPD